MLKLALAALGGLGGGATVVYFAIVGGPQGEGAVYALQTAAILFAMLVFGACMYLIIDTVKHQQHPEQERKPGPPADEDDERTRRKRRSQSIDDDDLYGRPRKLH